MVFRIDYAQLIKWLLISLLVTEVVLVLLDAFINEFRFASVGAARSIFNITREDALPNFFSSFQLLAVGGVLFLITLVVKAQSLGTGSRVTTGWGLLTGAFIYMGIDDATKMHERIGSIFKAWVTDSRGEGNVTVLGQLYDVFPSYSWQLVFLPIIAVMGLFTVYFLFRQLPTLKLRALIIVALGLFIFALGLDFVEGMDNDLFARVGEFFSTSEHRAVHFSKSIEEWMEMVGTTVFLFVFLSKLRSLTSSLTFTVDRSP